MMRDGAGLFVHRIGAEIGDVILHRGDGFLRRHHRAGAGAPDVRSNLHRYLAMGAVIDHALRIGAAIPIAAVDPRADVAPGADELVVHLSTGHGACTRPVTTSPKCTASR